LFKNFAAHFAVHRIARLFPGTRSKRLYPIPKHKNLKEAGNAF
jgi:hypothetical protein